MGFGFRVVWLGILVTLWCLRVSSGCCSNLFKEMWDYLRAWELVLELTLNPVN